jgi:hypothetical protein
MNTENKSNPTPLGSTNPVFRADAPNGGGRDVRNQAGDAVSKLTDVAQAAGQQAKATASSLAWEANEKAKGVMNQQVAAGADWVGHIAEATKAAADSLKQNAPQFSDLVRDAAIRVEKFSKNLKDQSVSVGLGLYAAPARCGLRVCRLVWFLHLPAPQDGAHQGVRNGGRWQKAHWRLLPSRVFPWRMMH